MSDYVNPELPAEIRKFKEDLIGETLFSKHWLCELLLKIIKVKPIINETNKPWIQIWFQKKVEEPQNETGQEEGFKELDPDFEKDLCELWDMSVEYDVNTNCSQL